MSKSISETFPSSCPHIHTHTHALSDNWKQTQPQSTFGMINISASQFANFQPNKFCLSVSTLQCIYLWLGYNSHTLFSALINPVYMCLTEKIILWTQRRIFEETGLPTFFFFPSDIIELRTNRLYNLFGCISVMTCSQSVYQSCLNLDFPPLCVCVLALFASLCSCPQTAVTQTRGRTHC